MKFYTLFAAALAALALVTLAAGCSPKGSASEPPNLDGTSWSLIQINGQDLIPETQATLTFDGDQINGKASCNNYFGSVTIKDDSFSVGMVGNTEMWCMEPEGVMDQETDYLKTLSAVARYSVENDELTLFDADGQSLLVFAPEAN